MNSLITYYILGINVITFIIYGIDYEKVGLL